MELPDGEPSSDDDEGEVEDDERYRDMLAAVTGGEGRPAVVARKRRHDVLVSEAYPESEFNLNPNAATAGAYTFPPSFLNSIVSTWMDAVDTTCLMLLIIRCTLWDWSITGGRGPLASGVSSSLIASWRITFTPECRTVPSYLFMAVKPS